MNPTLSLPACPEIIDVVVDMQNDFVTGALGTPEAAAIAVAVAQAVRGALDAGHGVVFTRDTHQPGYLATREGRELPVPHCIEGTPGWELIPPLAELSARLGHAAELNKPTFGAIALPGFIRERFGQSLAAGALKKFRVYGVCTGICVISNAVVLRAAFPEVDIEVPAACCACVTPDSHRTALQAMKTLQFHIV